MVKIEECNYMELYEIAYADVELVGSKIILCLYLRDIYTEVLVKRVSISATNIPKFLKNNGQISVLHLARKTVRCLTNNISEINYVGLIEGEWTICKDIH